MKSLLVFLSFFIYTFSYSQTAIFSDSVEFYFLKYLNEHRKTLYGDTVVDLTINKNASLACEHHNNYLFDMVWINKPQNQDKSFKQEKYFISHGEPQKSTTSDGSTFEYKGKTQLIPNFADRIRYYNTNKDFGPIGEVINSGGVRPSNEVQAKKVLESFLNSPPHKKILENKNYKYIAIDVMIKGSMVSTVVVTGTGPNEGLKFNGH